MPELGFDPADVIDGAQRASLSGKVDQLIDLILKQQASRMDATKIGCQNIVFNPAGVLDHDFGEADDRCNWSPEFLTREGGKGTFEALARFHHSAELSSCADEESFDLFQQARHLDWFGIVVVASGA